MPGFSILPNDDCARLLIMHNLLGEWGVEVTVFSKIARGTSRAEPPPLRFLAGASLGAFAILLMLGAGPAEARHHSRFQNHPHHAAYAAPPSPHTATIP